MISNMPWPKRDAVVAPERDFTTDVDAILLTHAHVDHVGGLTLHGKPIFPRAEVVVSEAEADAFLGRNLDVLDTVGKAAAKAGPKPETYMSSCLLAELTSTPT